MQEKNKHILQEAIQKLPLYEPEALVWLAIDAELDVFEKENDLQNAINELPVYSPSPSLWENIEGELDTDFIKAGRLVWLKRISSVAAAIAFLIIGNLMLKQNSDQEKIIFFYSQETVDTDIIKQDWDEDDDAFKMVLAFCETKNIVCEMPEFIVLKSELEELNEAREELKKALDSYGTDAGLVAQLTRIEHDRSDVLKKMIAKI
jgi:hypothetical protein